MLIPEAEQVEAQIMAALAQTPWFPNPGPQTDAFFTPADYTFYGGAAGGGKTDWELGTALQHRRSIIFRREGEQLKGIIDRSKVIYERWGRYNSNEKTWYLRTADGVSRQVEFAGVQYEDDVRKYQGRDHDLKAFDELPNFTRSQFQFLSGWNRTSFAGQRTRVIGAGNPPTDAEGEWVIDFWGPWLNPQHPNPAVPGELRWYVVINSKSIEVESANPVLCKGEVIQPKSRTFIPARLADNPFLMATGYMATLQAMPEPLRSQMLYGDFNVGKSDNAWQVIPTEWIKAAQARWEARKGKRPENIALTALGGDVARGGKDRTVLARCFDWWFDALDVYPGSETPDGPTGAEVVLKALQGHTAPVNIDVIGIGASVYDSLRQFNALRNLNLSIMAVNFGAASYRRDKSKQLGFENIRAECYWRLREALDPNSGMNICLPPDRELLSELAAPRWKPLPNGNVLLEKKEDIMKRLNGRSPDKADAVALAFYKAPKPGILKV